MIFLADHNLEKHALLLSGTLDSLGWLDFLPISFKTFQDAFYAYMDRRYARPNREAISSNDPD